MSRGFWVSETQKSRVIQPATVHAELRGGRTVLTDLRAAPPWAPRPLADGRGGGASAGAAGWARVALVQTAATLLRGDRCALRIALGPGARLELVETGATVAHDVRGGRAARVRVEVELAEGARLRWLSRPLVLAAGCAVERETTVTLAAGAVALLRETVVLGRSGERPGSLSSTVRAVHAGRPLLHERLASAPPAAALPAAAPPAAAPPVSAPPASAPPAAAPPVSAPPAAAPPADVLAGVSASAAPLTSPIVAGDAAVVDAVMLLGARGAALPGASQLAGPGTLWRALHQRDVDPDRLAHAVAAAWSDEVDSS